MARGRALPLFINFGMCFTLSNLHVRLLNAWKTMTTSLESISGLAQTKVRGSAVCNLGWRGVKRKTQSNMELVLPRSGISSEKKPCKK